MKKYIVSGLLVLSVLFPVASFAEEDIDPTPNISSCVSINNNLRYQSRDITTNGEVSTFQDFLQSQGYLNSEPTGYFGLLTVAATKSFQTANAISPTGFVGPLTRAKIQALTCGNQTIPNVNYEINGVKSDGGDKVIKVNYGEPVTVSWSSNGEWCQGYTYDSTSSWNKKLTASGSEIVKDLSPGQHVIVIYCYSTKYEQSNYAKDDRLTVEIVPTSNSSITVLSPNGGEVLRENNTVSVRWSSTNVPRNTLLNVWLLDNPTRLGSMVLARVPNTGSANWVVAPLTTMTDPITNRPITPSGNYVIFIECADHSCLVDDSNAPFTITSSTIQPTIKVSSPNGGETWKKGTTETIKWRDSGGSACRTGTRCAPTTYEIKLQPIGGCSVSVGLACATVMAAPYTIAKGITGSSYRWSVGDLNDPSVSAPNMGISAPVPDGSYYMEVCKTGTTNCDSSDREFKITSSTTQPSITVLSPNGGETLTQGVTHTIRWRDTNTSGHQIRLFTYTPGCGANPTCAPAVFYPIVTSTGSSFSWPVGQISDGRVLPNGAYTIQVCRTDLVNCDSSDGPFNIVGSTTQRSVTILSPNGGEAYKVGDTLNILWSSSGTLPTDIAEVVLEDTREVGDTPEHFVLDVSVPNSGSYSWRIPASTAYATLNGGNVYRASVTVRNSEGNNVGAGYDRSDSLFSIVGKATTGSSVTVLSPNGAETLVEGTTQTIKWQEAQSCPSGLSCLTLAPNYDITLNEYFAPCTSTTTSCPMYFRGPLTYTIAKNVTDVTYNWVVSRVLDTAYRFATAPDGLYTVQVCQSGTGNCDSSDKYFTLATTSGTFSTSSSGSLSGNVLGAKTYHFTQELMFGSKGTEVSELQKYLQSHGYSAGPADGIFGGSLNRALVDFQTANNIWADGIVGPSTRAVLNK